MRALLLALAACGAGGGDDCARFCTRLGELSHSPVPEADRAVTCGGYTAEQLHCGAKADSLDALMLCQQFVDADARAKATPLLASLRADLPGNTPLLDVLGGTVGCALGGIVSVDADGVVTAMYAVRDASHTSGDAQKTYVPLVRVGAGGAWGCEATLSAEDCADFRAQCGH